MVILLVPLLALSAVVIASGSLRRQGRMTAATQRVLVGAFVLLALLVAVIVLVDRVEAR